MRGRCSSANGLVVRQRKFQSGKNSTHGAVVAVHCLATVAVVGVTGELTLGHIEVRLGYDLVQSVGASAELLADVAVLSDVSIVNAPKQQSMLPQRPRRRLLTQRMCEASGSLAVQFV